MPGRPINHIGFLVEDLEAAIEHWTEILGYTFSPIARYRTANFTESDGAEPHFHDARIALSREQNPFIELMEFSGEGTHSARNGEGLHHIAFTGIDDVEAEVRDLLSKGVNFNGTCFDDEGKILLTFTDKTALNNVRLELVRNAVQPVVRDDGSPLALDSAGVPTLWG